MAAALAQHPVTQMLLQGPVTLAERSSCHRAHELGSYRWHQVVTLKQLAGRSIVGRKESSSKCYSRRLSVRASQGGVLEQPYGLPEVVVPTRWDVVGLGQAMVDFSGAVNDDIIESLELEKGRRKVVDHEERSRVLSALDGKSYKLSAGGSLSNTLVALARLGQAGQEGQLNVAMTGSVGSDPLGQFYRTKLLRANVHFLSKPIDNGTTGTVVVLTTPDAQRTMLSYQGMSSEVEFDDMLQKAVGCTRALVVEGYLWEIPRTIEAIQETTKVAREQGCLVALTASDVSCVKRYREKLWSVLASDADLLFANSDEARALMDAGPSTSAASAAASLSCICPMVAVTDGQAGSYLGLGGEVVYIPPTPCVELDTCGAGDAYAAGILYGLLRGGLDLRNLGAFASKVAAKVVSQQGARLSTGDAMELVNGFLTGDHMRGALLGGASRDFLEGVALRAPYIAEHKLKCELDC